MTSKADIFNITMRRQLGVFNQYDICTPKDFGSYFWKLEELAASSSTRPLLSLSEMTPLRRFCTCFSQRMREEETILDAHRGGVIVMLDYLYAWFGYLLAERESTDNVKMSNKYN